jgi:hypothetical protein
VKRIAVTILFGACLGVLPTRAAAGDVRVGALVGPNWTTLRIESGPPDLEVKKHTGIAVGAVLAWRPRESWSVELRPSYVGRGSRTVVAGQSVDIRTPFVDLPVVITQDLGSGRLRPYVLAGGAVGFRTSATADFPSGEQDVGDDFASTDASLRFGTGLRWVTASSQPFLEVEYTLGLTDLNGGTGLGTGLGPIRNRGFQVRGGLAFRLGKK